MKGRRDEREVQGKHDPLFWGGVTVDGCKKLK